MHENALAIVKSAWVGSQGLTVGRVGIGVEEVLFVCDFSDSISAPCIDVRACAERSIGQRQAGDGVVVNTVSVCEVGRVVRRTPAFPAFLVSAKERL